MAGTLGTIRGQITLNVRQALAAYTAVRLANAATTLALTRSSAAFIAAGRGMGLAGLAIGAGFVYAVKKAADFERQLDFFQAVSDSTEASMEKVRAKALELGKDTRYSAGEIADSFVELGKAGVSAEQIIDGVGLAVANLGAAADIPLDRAAQIMTSAVQTFELSAKDAVHVADLLAGAANASIVEIEDLGVSLKYVGGVAAAISLPIEDVIDGLALLGKYGIRGSTAGTSLRQILVSLSGTSKKASAELKKLGIITKDGTNLFFDAQGKAKPLGDIFQILQDHTENLTEAQRLSAFKIIFNNRALAAASVLAREGAAGFAKMNKEIGKTTAAEVASKRLDNLSGDIEILKGNIETFFIQAGTPFQQFLRNIVQGLTSLVQWFGNLDPATQESFFKFIAITAAALLFLGAVAKVIGIVIRLVRIVVELWRALQFVIGIVRAVAAVFGLIAAGLTPLGWIVIIVLAIAAAFIFLWNKCEGFRNFFIGLGKKIVEAFQAVVAWFQTLPETMSNIFNTVRDALISGWNAVFNFFTVTIPTWFSNMAATVASTLTTWYNNVINFFSSLPGILGGYISAAVTAIVGWFAQLPSRAGYWIGFLVGRAIRLFLDFHIRLFTIVGALVGAVVSWFAQLPGRIGAWLTLMVARGIQWFTAMKTATINLAVQTYNGIVNWFQLLPGRVASFFSQMYNRAVTWLRTTAASARAQAAAIYNNIVNWIRQLPGRISAFFNQMLETAKTKLEVMVATARTMATNIYNGLMDGLAKIPGAVAGAIGNAIQAFKDMVGRAFNAAKEFASGLWEGFKEGLGIHSPSFIEKQMVQITDVVNQETRALKAQVREIQSLGSKLTEVGTMPVNDQTLTSGYAASMISALSAEQQKLQAMKEQLQQAARDATPMVTDRTLAALSASSQRTASMITANAATETGQKKLVLLEGSRIGIDQNSQAWVRGIAVEVVNDNADFSATVGRM